MFKVTQEQIDFFETFGFIKFPQLMSDRLDWILVEFGKTFTEQTSIPAHDGTQRTCIVPFIDHRMCGLLDDPRIEAIGSAFLGSDFNYMGSDGNYYSGETGWHRDGYHPKQKHLKIAFYLDRLDGNSGALRVIPGSHRLNDKFGSELTGKMSNPLNNWNVDPITVPCHVLDVVPGDLLVFDHNTYHASFNGGSNRRMFTINLCERYEQQDVPQLREYISGMARFWVDRCYGEKMITEASPARMVHLEQVMANDGHLAALSAEMKTKMKEPARG